MPRDKIILIAAFTSGLLAFVLVFSQMSKAAKPAYSVVMANQDVAGGQALSKEHLAVSKPLRNLKTEDFFLQPVDAIGFVPKEFIKKGEPIRRSKVFKPQTNTAVPPPTQASAGELPPMAIPPGMRVMELGSAEVDKIPDLIQTGYYVDLFGLRGPSMGEFAALVFSAPVLDVRRVQEKGVASISIGLTLEEAEDVAAGLKKGRLRLAVRTEPGEKIKRAKPRTGSMEIIRGSSVPSVVSFSVGADAGAPRIADEEGVPEEPL